MVNKTIIYHVDFVLNKCLKSKIEVDNTIKIKEVYEEMSEELKEENASCDDN